MFDLYGNAWKLIRFNELTEVEGRETRNESNKFNPPTTRHIEIQNSIHLVIKVVAAVAESCYGY